VCVPGGRSGQEFAAGQAEGQKSSAHSRRSVLDAPLPILPIAHNDEPPHHASRPRVNWPLSLGAFVKYIGESVFTGSSDYLVNPCNCQTTLYWGTHVSEYIFSNAGKEVRDERGRSGHLPLGGYCITKVGKLKHKYILHIAVLNAFSLDIRYLFRLRKRIPFDVLGKALDTIADFCIQKNIGTIDVPAFWSGKNGWNDREFDNAFASHKASQFMLIYRGRA